MVALADRREGRKAAAAVAQRLSQGAGRAAPGGRLVAGRRTVVGKAGGLPVEGQGAGLGVVVAPEDLQERGEPLKGRELWEVVGRVGRAEDVRADPPPELAWPDGEHKRRLPWSSSS